MPSTGSHDDFDLLKPQASTWQWQEICANLVDFDCASPSVSELTDPAGPVFFEYEVRNAVLELGPAISSHLPRALPLQTARVFLALGYPLGRIFRGTLN